MIADADVESVVDDRATTGGDDGLALARWSDQAAWGRAPSCDDARVSEDVVALQMPGKPDRSKVRLHPFAVA